MSSFGDSLAELVRVNETRVTAGLLRTRAETVLLLLLVGSALSLAMIGYSAGLRGKRSVLSAVVLTLALGIVLALVIDLDRPSRGSSSSASSRCLTCSAGSWTWSLRPDDPATAGARRSREGGT